MFWKKRKADDFSIEVKEERSSAAERRESFRIGSDPENPVKVRIDGKDFNASNISIGGLAVRSRKLADNSRYSIRLQLPDDSPAIHTELMIVSTSAQGLCRCKFLQLSETSRSALQRYILSREKEKIRNARAGRG